MELTAFIAADVAEVLTTLESYADRIWIDGGWGVDALVAEQTREVRFRMGQEWSSSDEHDIRLLARRFPVGPLPHGARQRQTKMPVRRATKFAETLTDPPVGAAGIATLSPSPLIVKVWAMSMSGIILVEVPLTDSVPPVVPVTIVSRMFIPMIGAVPSS